MKKNILSVLMLTTGVFLLSGLLFAGCGDEKGSAEKDTVKKAETAGTSEKQEAPAAQESAPAAATDQQPATATDQKPAAAADQQPATATDQKPAAAADQQPATATDQKSATATDQQPATATDQKPATGTTAEQPQAGSDAASVPAGQEPVPPMTAKTTPQDKIASVNGNAIIRAEYDRELARLQEQLMKTGKPPSQAEMLAAKKTAVDNLVGRELLLDAAKADGKKVTDEEVEAELAKIKERFASEEEFTKALAEQNLTLDDIRREYQLGLVVQRFIEDKFVKTTTVTDEEAKKYYDENPGFFMQPETVHARHILIQVPEGADENRKAEAMKKIKDVQQKVKDGADFAEMAKEFSEGPSNVRGGDLGYFRRGQMVGPFEDVAFTLKPGEVSDIVETRFGYHLIKVEDKKPEGLIPFDQVKEQLTGYIKQDRIQMKVNQFLAEQKKSAKIEVFLPDIENVY